MTSLVILNVVLAIAMATAITYYVIIGNRTREILEEHVRKVREVDQKATDLEIDNRALVRQRKDLEKMVDTWKVKFANLDQERKEFDRQKAELEAAQAIMSRKLTDSGVKITRSEINRELKERKVSG